MSTLNNRLDGLSPERRQRVEDRARVLIAEEMSLRDLCRAREQTQASVAARLGMSLTRIIGPANRSH